MPDLLRFVALQVRFGDGLNVEDMDS